MATGCRSLAALEGGMRALSSHHQGVLSPEHTQTHVGFLVLCGSFLLGQKHPHSHAGRPRLPHRQPARHLSASLKQVRARVQAPGPPPAGLHAPGRSWTCQLSSSRPLARRHRPLRRRGVRTAAGGSGAAAAGDATGAAAAVGNATAGTAAAAPQASAAEEPWGGGFLEYEQATEAARAAAAAAGRRRRRGEEEEEEEEEVDEEDREVLERRDAELAEHDFQPAPTQAQLDAWVAEVVPQVRALFPTREISGGTLATIELVLRVGVPLDKVMLVFERYPPLLRGESHGKIAATLALYTETDGVPISRRQLARMIVKWPKNLSTPPTDSQARTLRYLVHGLRVPPEHIGRVLSDCPKLLSLHCSTLEEKVAILLDVGFANVGEALCRFPPLLTYQRYKLREKAAVLAEIFTPPARVSDVLQMHPLLFHQHPRNLRASFQFLCDAVGEDAARRMVAMQPLLLGQRKELLALKLDNLREIFQESQEDVLGLVERGPGLLGGNMGGASEIIAWLGGEFGHATMMGMLEKQPVLLHYKLAPMKTKLAFYLDVVGRTHMEVARTPTLLALGYESRLLPRWERLVAAGLQHKYALSTMFTSANEVFERMMERNIARKPVHRLTRSAVPDMLALEEEVGGLRPIASISTPPKPRMRKTRRASKTSVAAQAARQLSDLALKEIQNVPLASPNAAVTAAAATAAGAAAAAPGGRGKGKKKGKVAETSS